MTRVSFQSAPVAPSERRPAAEVLGVKDSGPSATGSTFWKSLFSCPREHALANIADVHPERLTEPLTLGWLYHLALESFYRSMLEFQRTCDAPKDSDEFYFGGLRQAQRAAWEAVNPVAHEPGYEGTWAELERMLQAYIDQFWGHDKWRILAVEETLAYITKDLEYSARLDLVAEIGGEAWIVEHKTARTIGDDLLSGYDMDLQILGQLWLFEHCVDTKALGVPFGGVLINITSKHKPPRFVRKEVLPSKLHLDSFEHAIGQWRKARGNMEALGWPKALGHCSGYARGYSRCAYYDLCHSYPHYTFSQWMKEQPPIGYRRGR